MLKPEMAGEASAPVAEKSPVFAHSYGAPWGIKLRQVWRDAVLGMSFDESYVWPALHQEALGWAKFARAQTRNAWELTLNVDADGAVVGEIAEYGLAERRLLKLRHKPDGGWDVELMLLRGALGPYPALAKSIGLFMVLHLTKGQLPH